MPDTTIAVIDKSLEALLRTEVDFPGYALDLCSGYVSTDGVLLLKRMLKKAPRVRAVVGLHLINHVSAFQMLHYDCGVEFSSEGEYKKQLYIRGIKPKTTLTYAIPPEARQVAIDTLFEF